MTSQNRLPAASSTARGVARDQRKVPTDSERLLWSELRDRRLDGWKFRRQQPAGTYVLDFYCQELSLAIEVDGAYHDLTPSKDQRRQRNLENQGIRFIRVLAEDVEPNREAIINYIRAEIARLSVPARRAEHLLPSPAHGAGHFLPSPAHGRGMSAEGGRGEGTPQ